MRNLFILVEGPDNVGKTTLINNIKNHFNDYTFQSLHFSNVKHNSIEEGIEYSTKQYTEMFEMMLFLSKFDKAAVICDRSHLGEMVYGPIYRNYTGTYVLDIEKRFHNMLTFWDSLVLITLVDKPERLIARDDGLSFSIDIDKKNTEIANFKRAHIASNIKHKYLVDIELFDAESVKKVTVDFIETQVLGNKND